MFFLDGVCRSRGHWKEPDRLCTVHDGRTLATAVQFNPDRLLNALDAQSLGG